MTTLITVAVPRNYLTRAFTFFLVGFALLSTVRDVGAEDPPVIAVSDRSTWPDPVNSVETFDRASRAEILAFSKVLIETESVITEPSVQSFLGLLWASLEAAYASASARCRPMEPFCPMNNSRVLLRERANVFARANWDQRYTPWLKNALAFHRAYLNELLRLAILFPRISSEIETYNTNEISGTELPDRQFLLTFDDGPTIEPNGVDINNGDTDRLMILLRELRLSAVAFVLGENFEARLQRTSPEDMRALYSGMCVGSHGWLHVSHAKWEQWEQSVLTSTALIRDVLPGEFVPLFRPPYGERRADSGEFFANQRLRVVLWNIDSQDWRDTVLADDAASRVMTLMLLWRHGIVLFHDVYPKAQTAVPQLAAWAARVGVHWLDCHRISSVRRQ